MNEKAVGPVGLPTAVPVGLLCTFSPSCSCQSQAGLSLVPEGLMGKWVVSLILWTLGSLNMHFVIG